MNPLIKFVQLNVLALQLHRDISHTDITTIYQLRGALADNGIVFITVPLPTIIVRHWFVRINARCGFPNDELILRTFDTFEKRSP